MSKTRGYADLADMVEDERIDVIARYVLTKAVVAGVAVDDEPGKPERYTKKLEARGCRVVAREPGPIAGVITLKVEAARCDLCGELMHPNEMMFRYHGYFGPCPTKAPEGGEADG